MTLKSSCVIYNKTKLKVYQPKINKSIKKENKAEFNSHSVTLYIFRI